jgi:hypothetical protein
MEVTARPISAVARELVPLAREIIADQASEHTFPALGQLRCEAEHLDWRVGLILCQLIDFYRAAKDADERDLWRLAVSVVLLILKGV